jgi:hypothetical protein
MTIHELGGSYSDRRTIAGTPDEACLARPQSVFDSARSEKVNPAEPESSCGDSRDWRWRRARPSQLILGAFTIRRAA